MSLVARNKRFYSILFYSIDIVFHILIWPLLMVITSVWKTSYTSLIRQHFT